MRAPRLWLAAVSTLALSAPALAQDQQSLMAAVTKDVKEVCTQPKTAGEHWSVSGNAAADAGVQVKLLKLGSLSGGLRFTKEEWSGIQRVLAKDQVGDNQNYRECVKELTPLFLGKVQGKGG